MYDLPLSPEAEARIFAVIWKEEGRNNPGCQILQISPLQWLSCNVLETCHIIPASMPLLEQFFPPKTPFRLTLSTFCPIQKVLRSSSNCISSMKPSIHETFPKISSPYRPSLFAEVLTDKLTHLSFFIFWHLVVFFPTINLAHAPTTWHHI